MSDASWPLQQALYQHLAADPGLAGLLGTPPRIHDDTPAEPVFPFLAIGAARQREWPGVAGGQEHALTFHAWSRHGGRQEVKQLMATVSAALDEVDLAVTGYRLVMLTYLFGDAFRQADNETWLGVMRFRALTQPL